MFHPFTAEKSLSGLVICFILGIVIQSTSAQEFKNGPNPSKHTFGYAVSYAFPKLADGSKNTSVKSEFNYGVSGSFDWGKYYKSGVSFMIAPMFYYAHYNNSVVSRTYTYNPPIRYNESTIQVNELTVCFPLSYEFPMFRSFRFGGGAHISFPLFTSGTTTTVFYRQHQPPDNDTDEEEYQFEPRLGVSGRMMYQIRANEKVESYLSLEYWYDVTLSYSEYVHQTRFGLSYIHRFIKLKDKREKWDKMMIRQGRPKGSY
jgi:hypothetical protein